MRCPTWSGSLWELEWRWRIPRKTNDKGWNVLKAKVSQDAAAFIRQRRRTGAAKLAKLDEQIANVEKQRDSQRKATTLRKLRSEPTRTSNHYA